MVEEELKLPSDFKHQFARSEVRTALSTVANDEAEDYDQPAQRVLEG